MTGETNTLLVFISSFSMALLVLGFMLFALFQLKSYIQQRDIQLSLLRKKTSKAKKLVQKYRDNIEKQVNLAAQQQKEYDAKLHQLIETQKQQLESAVLAEKELWQQQMSTIQQQLDTIREEQTHYQQQYQLIQETKADINDLADQIKSLNDNTLMLKGLSLKTPTNDPPALPNDHDSLKEGDTSALSAPENYAVDIEKPLEDYNSFNDSSEKHHTQSHLQSHLSHSTLPEPAKLPDDTEDDPLKAYSEDELANLLASSFTDWPNKIEQPAVFQESDSFPYPDEATKQLELEQKAEQLKEKLKASSTKLKSINELDDTYQEEIQRLNYLMDFVEGKAKKVISLIFDDSLEQQDTDSLVARLDDTESLFSVLEKNMQTLRESATSVELATTELLQMELSTDQN